MTAVAGGRLTLQAVFAAAFASRAFSFGVLVAVTLIWCSTLPHGIIMGDDLGLVRAVQSGKMTPLSAFTDVGGWSKYRPLTDLLFALIIPLAGSHFAVYEAINALVECVAAIVLAAIVLRLTAGNALLAICTGGAFIVSRFAYYQIMQVIGLFEGVALLFALIAIYHAVVAYRTGIGSQLVRTLLWSVLALFADERYLALLPFVVAAGLAFPPTDRFERAAAWRSAIGAAATLVFYYVLKRFVFHSAFVTVTSGRQLSLDPTQLAAFGRAAILNVLGFNVGPEYLSGADLSQLGPAGLVAGFLAAALPLAAILGWVWREWRKDRSNCARMVVIGLSLFVPLLATACVSYRLEFRWLYAAYTVYLIAAAGAAGALRLPRRLGAVCVLAAAVFIAGGQLYYRTFIQHVYFTYEMEWGRVVRRTLLADRPTAAVVVTHDDPSIDQWTFEGHQFLDEYGFHDVQLTYLASPAELGRGDAAADVFEKVGTDMVVRSRPPSARSDASAQALAPGVSAPPRARYPVGIVGESHPESSGVYPANGGEDCCWTARDVRFAVRVPPGAGTLLSLRLYVPKSGPFAHRAQAVSLLSATGATTAHATVPVDQVSTITLALPRAALAGGLARVHLRFAESFVPSKSGTGPDDRDLAAVLQSVSVR